MTFEEDLVIPITTVQQLEMFLKNYFDKAKVKEAIKKCEEIIEYDSSPNEGLDLLKEELRL